MPPILLHQPDLHGHRSEFLAYLVRAASLSENAAHVALSAPEEFRHYYDSIYGPNALERSDLPLFLQTGGEISEFIAKNSRHALLKLAISESAAKHVFVDEINKYFIPRARPISAVMWGILYGPYVRLVKPSLFTYWRKQLSISLFLARHNVGTLWVLNDRKGADILNRKHPRFGKFEFLPDPVWPDEIFANIPLRNNSQDNRVNLIFFGTPRVDKGPLVLLEAMQKLPIECQAKIRLTFAGKNTGRDAETFRNALNAAQRNAPRAELVHLDRFISYGETASLVSSCDAFLLPYVRTDRSSGVLGMAARFGKPVIASESGLLGELVKKHGLGDTVPTGNAEALNQKLRSFIAGRNLTNFNANKARSYADSRSCRVFADTIFSSMMSSEKPTWTSCGSH